MSFNPVAWSSFPRITISFFSTSSAAHSKLWPMASPAPNWGVLRCLCLSHLQTVSGHRVHIHFFLGNQLGPYSINPQHGAWGKHMVCNWDRVCCPRALILDCLLPYHICLTSGVLYGYQKDLSNCVWEYLMVWSLPLRVCFSRLGLGWAH